MEILRAAMGFPLLMTSGCASVTGFVGLITHTPLASMVYGSPVWKIINPSTWLLPMSFKRKVSSKRHSSPIRFQQWRRYSIPAPYQWRYFYWSCWWPTPYGYCRDCFSVCSSNKVCMWTLQEFFFWSWTLFVHCWPTEGLEFKLVGNSLRYWFDYVCSSIIPVAFHASPSYLLMYFITLILIQLPPLWKYFNIYLVFAIMFGALSPSTPPPSNSKLRQNWKYVHKFRRHRLAYHLVIRYRRRVCQRPRWLNGTDFSSPLYGIHLRSRRRKPKAKVIHHRQQVIKPESNFQLSGDYHFRLYEPISPHIFFLGLRDFTILYTTS